MMQTCIAAQPETSVKLQHARQQPDSVGAEHSVIPGGWLGGPSKPMCRAKQASTGLVSQQTVGIPNRL